MDREAWRDSFTFQVRTIYFVIILLRGVDARGNYVFIARTLLLSYRVQRTRGRGLSEQWPAENLFRRVHVQSLRSMAATTATRESAYASVSSIFTDVSTYICLANATATRTEASLSRIVTKTCIRRSPNTKRYLASHVAQNAITLPITM